MISADSNFQVPPGSSYGTVAGFVIIAVVLAVVAALILFIRGDGRR